MSHSKKLCTGCLPPGTARTGRSQGHERMRAVFVLRTEPLHESHPVAQKLGARCDHPEHWPKLTRREVAELQSPAEGDLREVLRFGRRHGLRVVASSWARHDVTLEGTCEQFERALGIELHDHDSVHGPFHAYDDDAHLPAPLCDIVEDVIGLDETPRYRPFAMTPGPIRKAFSPIDLAEHYGFPSDLSGEGQRIAILSFGGGYSRIDLDDYFRKLLKIPAPVVREVPVEPGARNNPLPRARIAEIARAFSGKNVNLGEISNRFGNDVTRAMEDFEVTQDIQIAGAVANGAAIDVYFARGDDAGIYAAIYAALGLGGPFFQRRGPPAAISISWGLSECANHMSPAGLRAVDRAMEAARLLDVPVICATGDFGSWGSSPEICGPGVASVSFPASSATALACGGTQFRRRRDGSFGDVVWNAPNRGMPQATGGGVSGRWKRPDYQKDVDVPKAKELGGRAWLDPIHPKKTFEGRGVPDVSAYANPMGGYKTLIGGVQTAGGGTSAAAPFWAGLCARLCERMGDRMPWLNEVVYQPEFRPAFRSVQRGDNDLSDGRAVSFEASAGWDPCSGLGVPNGAKLLELLEKHYGREDC